MHAMELHMFNTVQWHALAIRALLPNQLLLTSMHAMVLFNTQRLSKGSSDDEGISVTNGRPSKHLQPTKVRGLAAQLSS